MTKINNKKWVRVMMAGLFFCLLTPVSCILTSCVDNDDDVPMSRYSAEKMTAAEFLSDNQERVGSFINILQRSGYYAMLSTYGNYTVFAPNNEAIDKYMASNSYKSIEDIPEAVCDTLARTHIIKTKAWFSPSTPMQRTTMPWYTLPIRWPVWWSSTTRFRMAWYIL